MAGESAGVRAQDGFESMPFPALLVCYATPLRPFHQKWDSCSRELSRHNHLLSRFGNIKSRQQKEQYPLTTDAS